MVQSSSSNSSLRRPTALPLSLALLLSATAHLAIQHGEAFLIVAPLPAVGRDECRRHRRRLDRRHNNNLASLMENDGVCQYDDGGDGVHDERVPALFVSRRRMLNSAVALLGSGAALSLPAAAAEDEEELPKVVPGGDVNGGNGPGSSSASGTDGGVIMYKTSSGLKYIELKPSASTQRPRYGQLCIISYTAYLKLPTGQKEKEKFDQATDYITKHGNGRLIPGLDEGLHTMTVGSTRRLIIPPKLGFIGSGLGPMPSGPFDRRKLNRLLDKMIEQKGGNLVYDVTLTKILDDEADQGYYQDQSLSPEELEAIRRNLRVGAATSGDA